MTTHRPYRSWCKFCVMGRGVNTPHRRYQVLKMIRKGADYESLGEGDSEETSGSCADHP